MIKSLATKLDLTLWEKIYIPLKHILHYTVIAGLTLQGFYTLALSVKFIFEKSNFISNGFTEQVTENTVNIFASQAIINIISTSLSLFLAATIVITKNKIIKTISVILGLIIFFANYWLVQSINQAGFFSLIIEPIQKTIGL
jgi:hypothetical protein